jgi:hypothetical protein
VHPFSSLWIKIFYQEALQESTDIHAKKLVSSAKASTMSINKQYTRLGYT